MCCSKRCWMVLTLIGHPLSPSLWESSFFLPSFNAVISVNCSHQCSTSVRDETTASNPRPRPAPGFFPISVIFWSTDLEKEPFTLTILRLLFPSD